jgi:hypothetical protein
VAPAVADLDRRCNAATSVVSWCRLAEHIKACPKCGCTNFFLHESVVWDANTDDETGGLDENRDRCLPTMRRGVRTLTLHIHRIQLAASKFPAASPAGMDAGGLPPTTRLRVRRARRSVWVSRLTMQMHAENPRRGSRTEKRAWRAAINASRSQSQDVTVILFPALIHTAWTTPRVQGNRLNASHH